MCGDLVFWKLWPNGAWSTKGVVRMNSLKVMVTCVVVGCVLCGCSMESDADKDRRVVDGMQVIRTEHQVLKQSGEINPITAYTWIFFLPEKDFAKDQEWLKRSLTITLVGPHSAPVTGVWSKCESYSPDAGRKGFAIAMRVPLDLMHYSQKPNKIIYSFFHENGANNITRDTF